MALALESAWKDPSQVEVVARKTLDQDEGELPPFYIPILTTYMRLHPYDANFILEFAEKGKSWTGGNGFGTVTCMDCWKDIILDASPTRPNGGKDEGFGSFYNYQVHCMEVEHLRGRNERLRQFKVTPPPISVEIPDLEEAHSSPAPSAPTLPTKTFIKPAPPPASASSSSRRPSSTTSMSSQPLQSLDSNRLDEKPVLTSQPLDKGKGKASSYSEPIYISSDDEDDDDVHDQLDDSDSDVEFLDVARVPPALKKVTNQANPFLVDSDDEDSAPSSSFASRLAQLPKKNISTSSHKSLAPIFSSPAKSSQVTSLPVRAPTVKSETSLNQPPSTSGGDNPASTTTSGSGIPPPIYAPQQAIPFNDVAPRVRLPSTWYANELAHLQSERATGPSVHIEQKHAIDPTRPRLEDHLNSLPFASRQRVAIEERKVMLDLYRIYHHNAHYRMLIAQQMGLMQQIRYNLTERYILPDFQLLIIGGTALEKAWEHSCPYIAISTRMGDVKPWTDLQNAVAGPSSVGHVKYEPGTSSALDPLKQSFAQVIRAGMNAMGVDIGHIGMPGGYPMPSGQLYGNDDSDHGYEHDRPRNAEGLADLFKTALDDFQEDTDVETALKGLDMQRLEDRISGLKIQLMPHQVLGVHWMIQQEKKPACQGGILGDQMGLGKTVQTIATMVKNPSDDRTCRTTLIVVPLPLIQQWKAEIESKSGLTVLIYHGANRTKSSNQLKSVDCVITTYSMVSSDAADLIGGTTQKRKKKQYYADWIDDDDDEEDVKPKSLVRKKGPLLKVKWYRIILDEAAIVRNRKTKASKAIQELEGDKRWCLTGTLIYNSLTDIYPYLRFVGIIHWEDFRQQVHLIATRKPRLASRRAQALLRKVMLRRTKESKLHGKKILQLPPKTIDMVELDFTEEERAIYTAIETAARIKVNKWYKAGTLLKQYHVVLVMLTRLRQFCCHPWLLRASEEYQATHDAGYVNLDEEDDGPNKVEPMAQVDVDQVQRAVAAHGQDWVDKVTKKLKDRHQQMLEEADEEDANDSSCPICFDTFTDEAITSCVHSFCSTCINGILDAPPRDGVVDDFARDARPCPICRTEVKRDDLFPAKAFFNPETWQQQELVDETAGLDIKPFSLFVKQEGSSSAKRKRELNDDVDSKRVKTEDKGKGKAKVEPDVDDDDNGENLDDVDIEDVEPSTKMKRIADLLDMWKEVDASQKTLIFCSFVEMLELMAVFLRKRGIKYVLYTGKMKTEDRDEAIREFSKVGEGTPTVMLISLKCGGVGLNLTAANNVIGLDLAWSPASEAQAIDRAHRIGQTRPVSVKRLIVRDSVEQRILALQEKKQMITDGAMGEGDGGRLPRLSARDLLNLFGANAGDD